ncbi:MAG: serine/threonine-protein phosphatase [Ignavibacteriales bacterium]|mgnify:FL=1|jgi:protein phosphatase|nr:serine/threonine-protein phosphatase [Ignavibacteriales bacterium]MBP9121209.1 serine/threonine-protein phosphatase [Ignavibacterium sp.]RPI65028.1 MAG: serine/threonine-protein phosphatase [Ignavibacteriales bacterium]
MGFNYLRFTSPGSEKKFNEDAVETTEINDGLLAVLCDGVGGDNGGDLAARIALKSALYFFSASENGDYLEKIKLAIEESNSFVLNHSSTSVPLKNMATTLEIIFLKENVVYWGHIGDSRIYHLKSKRLNQITKDHSLVQKLLDEGYITHKQAANHPQKNVIIKALGDNALIEPDISKIKLNENEENRFFICSDGVSNLISNSELEEVLIIKDLEEIKNRLIKMIKLRGATDDYSFIVIEITK